MTGINRTHYARTVVAPASRPAVTSLPDRQPVISRPRRRLRALPGAAICCGAVTGAIQAVSPLAFWWLEPRTVYALGLTLIAAVYIGLSVADGRWQVIAAESSVAGFFVVVAAASVSGSAWLILLGLAGHGLKDLWQHRTQFVRNTRWWPPFWTTGYRSDYSWMHIPGVVGDGHVIHRRDVTDIPGLYFLGLPWQHSRGSALLGFVHEDAAYLADRITSRAPGQ